MALTVILNPLPSVDELMKLKRKGLLPPGVDVPIKITHIIEEEFDPLGEEKRLFDGVFY